MEEIKNRKHIKHNREDRSRDSTILLFIISDSHILLSVKIHYLDIDFGASNKTF